MKEKPGNRWGLIEVGRGTYENEEWVIYYDGTHNAAIIASDFDAPTEEKDYSLWCTTVTHCNAGEHAAEIADVCGCLGVHIDGSVWVYATSEKWRE